MEQEKQIATIEEPTLIGRPVTISIETIEKIAEEIRIGMPKTRAAALAGISIRTYYNWITKGEETLDKLAEDKEYWLTEEEQLYIALLHAVAQARAAVMKEGIEKITSEGPPGWKWLLPRLFREELGDVMTAGAGGDLPTEFQLVLPGLIEEETE
jgi:hypothetical protein